MSRVAIGLDVGGTKILGGLVDSEGRVLVRRRRPTPSSEGPQAVFGAMRAAIDELLALASGPSGSGAALATSEPSASGAALATGEPSASGADLATGEAHEVVGIGLGFPGPVDAVRGISRFSPNLVGFKDLPIFPAFMDYGLPLAMQNDVRCHAWGERCFGAGRGSSNFLLVTIGTGVGSGIIVDDHLYGGATGMAGEIGHIVLEPGGPLCGCGNRGCLEALASGTAIGRRTREAGLGQSAHDLFAKAREGDQAALALLDQVAADLGRGLAAAVTLLGPDRLLVGGGIASAGALILEPIRRHFDASLMPVTRGTCPLIPAQLGEEAGLVGAAALLPSLFSR